MDSDLERRTREAFAAYAAAVPDWTDRAEEIDLLAPRRPARRRTMILGMAAAAIVVVIAASAVYLAHRPSTSSGRQAGAHSGTTSAGVTSPALSTSPAPTPVSTPPAWTERCFPQRAKDRLGNAPEYLGLNIKAAYRLSLRLGDYMRIIGSDRHCGEGPSDFVYHGTGIALVFDHGQPAKSLVPLTAHVIAAERVSGSWEGPCITASGHSLARHGVC